MEIQLNGLHKAEIDVVYSNLKITTTNKCLATGEDITVLSKSLKCSIKVISHADNADFINEMINKFKGYETISLTATDNEVETILDGRFKVMKFETFPNQKIGFTLEQ